MRIAFLWALVLASAPMLSAQTQGETERVIRSHDIGFLSRAVPQYPATVWPTAGSLEIETDADGVGEAISFSESGEEEDNFADLAAPAGVVISPKALVDLITSNIAEDSWSNRRNSIVVDGDRLLIVQTQDVQDRIAALLGGLRARRALMIAVEIAVVPSTVFEESGGRRPFISAESFERAIAEAGPRARSISLTAYNEQTTNGLSGHLRTTSAQTEINQTGVIPVVNPVVLTLPIGLSLEARPRRITGTDWFRVDLRVARLEEAGEVLRRHTLFSDIEFVPLLEQSISTVLLLEAGRAGVAGRFREARPDGSEREFAVLARVTPVNVTAEATASAPTETFHLRVYDLAFLLEPFGDERTPSGQAWTSRIRSSVDREAWLDDRTSISVTAGPVLRVVARAETHRALRSWLEARVRERARLATIEVGLYTGPLDSIAAVVASADGGLYLDPEWRDGEPGSRLDRRFHSLGVGALDSRVRARGFEARSFVADVECVSGGTGFAILEMPGGVVVSAGDGFWLTATASPRLDPEVVTLSLEWMRCQTTFESSLEFFPGVQLAPAGGAGAPRDGAQQTVTVRMPFVIDLPRQSRESCHATLPLRAGRPAIVKVQKDEGATASLLVARVDVANSMEQGGER